MSLLRPLSRPLFQHCRRLLSPAPRPLCRPPPIRTMASGAASKAKNAKIADDAEFRGTLSLSELDKMEVYDADNNAVAFGSLHKDTTSIIGMARGRVGEREKKKAEREEERNKNKKRKDDADCSLCV